MNKLEQALLGLAVGDSMGLPMEGMSAKKIEHLRWMDKPRQRLFLGRGMVSDDTEHAMMTISAALKSEGNVKVFRKSLRWRLRWWVIGFPAGVGMATARSCFKMWLGIRRSGVFSAGNGPAMRSVMLGAIFAEDEERRKEYVRVSTELTHTDPKALVGASMVAELVALFVRNPDASDQEVEELIQSKKLDMESWKLRSEHGISGYILDTVPALLTVGRENDWDYKKSIVAVIKFGGDTDTIAAILGAICAVKSGDIPPHWIDGLKDYPRSVSAMNNLAHAETVRSLLNPSILWFALATIVRNMLFLIIVLGHGFRRMI